MRANKNNAGETPPMRLLDCDEAEPLPIDGMEVEEFRDADTVRLFMLELRRWTCDEGAARRVPSRKRSARVRFVSDSPVTA
jgi:hypothetical protein